jgi:hypothetical protein
MRNKEATMEQKERAFTREAVILDTIVFILLLYYTLTVSAYMSVHPRAGYAESIAAAFSVIMETPLYFIPVNYDVIVPLGTTVVFVLFLFVMQTMNFMRLHHNVNTLKGRTHWAEFDDILEKYGDFDSPQKKGR